MIDLTALKSEIDTDPAAIGYAGQSDVTIAGLINAVDAARRVNRRGIPTSEITQQIDLAEFELLLPTRRQWLGLVLSSTSIDTDTPAGNTAARDGLLVCFGAGSVTRANLVALLSRGGSRAEVLFGIGSRVTPSHIADARRQ